MDVIIYDDPERGTAVIVHPAYKDLARDVNETDDQLVQRVIAQSVPSGVTYSIMDSTDIPTDRTHRASWICDHIKGTIAIGSD